jgi:hypothetical protein
MLQLGYDFKINTIWSIFRSKIYLFIANTMFFCLQIYISFTIVLGKLERRYEAAAASWLLVPDLLIIENEPMMDTLFGDIREEERKKREALFKYANQNRR